MKKKIKFFNFNNEILIISNNHSLIKILILSFLIIYLFGLYFSIGISNLNNENITPHDICDIFNYTHSVVTERQYRIHYSVNSNNSIAKSNAQLLMRLKTSGKYFDQEMRFSDQQGYYSMSKSIILIFYELSQEGDTNFEFSCINKPLKIHNEIVEPYKIKSKFTIFHLNNIISNICIKNQSLQLFTSSYIHNFKDFLKNLSINNNKMKYIDYNSNLPIIPFGNFFIFKSLNGKEFIYNLLLPIFYFRFLKKPYYIFNLNEPSIITKLIKGSASKELYSKSHNFHQNGICFDEIYFNLKMNISNITSNDLIQFQNETMKKIPKNNSFIIFDLSLNDNNLNNLLKEIQNNNNSIQLINLNNLNLNEKLFYYSNSNIFLTSNEDELYYCLLLPINTIIIILINNPNLDIINLLKKSGKIIHIILLNQNNNLIKNKIKNLL